MSWAATAYVKSLRVDKNGKRLTKGHKLVLFVLADYHNEERGDAWTSLRHMAKESLYSRAGLILALHSMENGGLIRVVRHENAGKTRTTNRYIFPDLETIASIETRPALVKPVDHPGIATIPALVYPVDHIFPKNLSNQSNQKKERAREGQLTLDTPKEADQEEQRFEKFMTHYPHRGGKRLELSATRALFSKLSPADQAMIAVAAQHYTEDVHTHGLVAKNQRNFLRDLSGYEAWRDWIEPSKRAQAERPPPMPPKTDPIARGHWNRIYGHPK